MVISTFIIFRLKGIVQLRPSYSYFDKQDIRKKDNDKAENSEEDEESEAQQVSLILEISDKEN